MKVKKEWKSWLKTQLQKTKIRASSPLTSWQTDEEKVETVAEFIFLGSKITVDCDCSHEIKRRLLLGRKAMKKLDSILKSRDITLPTKGQLVRYDFSSGHVQMRELDHKEGWVPKNWYFQSVVLEKTQTAGDQTNQSKRKATLNIHWKDWSWRSNTLATWWKELTH